MKSRSIMCMFPFPQFCSTVRRKRALALCLALCTLGFSGSARAQSFTTFDAPGAGTAAGQGTYVSGPNPQGAILGTYLDASNVLHGCVRAKGGSITTFDAPGAGAGAFQGTLAYGLNPAGAITGYYLDASNVLHGYVRAKDGNFTTFDVPDAGTGAGQGTIAGNINPSGAIAGYYLDASNVLSLIHI